MFKCVVEGELRGVEDKSYIYSGTNAPRYVVRIEDEEGHQLSLTAYKSLDFKGLKKGDLVSCFCECFMKRDVPSPVLKLINVEER